MSAAVTFAFAAGLLATVNPCGFVMLPSFLGVYLGAVEEKDSSLGRVASAFLAGLVLAASFSGVFVITGLAVAAGLRAVLDATPWFALAIGVGLVGAGVAIMLGRRVGSPFAARPAGAPAAGYGRIAVFGATYALVSMSCTLAALLVVISQATSAGDPVRLVAVFGAYSAGSASVLIALCLSVALAKGVVARGLRRVAPWADRASGALLVASGAYLVLYWWPALDGSDQPSDSAATRVVVDASASVTSFLSTRTGAFAMLLAATTLAGAVLVVLERRRVQRP